MGRIQKWEVCNVVSTLSQLRRVSGVGSVRELLIGLSKEFVHVMFISPSFEHVIDIVTTGFFGHFRYV